MASSFSYKEYLQSLTEYLKSGEKSICLNNDRSHNASIMSFMLENSTKIDMYCGKMSVFRNGFYQYIGKDNPELGESLKKYVSNSLKKFLDKDNSQLRIILANEESIGSDLIAPETISEGIKKEKIDIKQVSQTLKMKDSINHFTVCDIPVFRFETNKDIHSALCCFHDKEMHASMQRNFDILYSYSEKLNG